MDHIIFFDGVCNLCNSSVDFIIRRDRKAVFKFISLQSPLATELLAPYPVDTSHMKTFVLLKQNKLFTRSDAALEVARDLDGIWRFLYYFKIVPGFIRNAVYRVISRNRYRWFGKRDTCRLPSASEKARFLESMPPPMSIETV